MWQLGCSCIWCKVNFKAFNVLRNSIFITSAAVFTFIQTALFAVFNYCSHFWIRFHVTVIPATILKVMQLFSVRGACSVRDTAQRSCWGESPALLCLLSSATLSDCHCTGCINGDCFDASAWRLDFFLFSSRSFRHSLLHGHRRPQRTSAGQERTCWGSAVSGDCTEEPQLNTKDPALHSRHAQILHSCTGERRFMVEIKAAAWLICRYLWDHKRTCAWWSVTVNTVPLSQVWNTVEPV